MNELNLEFRAWHKAEKVMCPVPVFNFDKQGGFLLGVGPGKDQCVAKLPLIVKEWRSGFTRAHFVPVG